MKSTPPHQRARTTWLTAALVALALCGALLHAGNVASAQVAGLTISGECSNEAGSVFANVTVTLSGTQSATTQTDAHGFFAFTGLAPGGTYTVTPARAGHNFIPVSQTYTNLGADRFVRFITHIGYTISGRITDAQGDGITGVELLVNGMFSGALTAPDGTYQIVTTRQGGDYIVAPQKGNYTFTPPSRAFLNLSANLTGVDFTGQAPRFEFSFRDATNGVDEGEPHATLNVVRTGDASVAASVEVQTLDRTDAVPCDDAISLRGLALARCDYATTFKTLTFAPGETTKQVFVPLVDDAYVEGLEEFIVRLDNASAGGAIGSLFAAQVLILDNDAAGAPNPIFTTPFFVRQHYLDFLAREPEAGEPWSNVLDACANPDNTDPNSASAQCDRLTVSAAFFGSPEFRLKGYFVYLFYRVAFDRLPAYSEIIPDMSRLSGATTEEVYQKRAAFAAAFTARTEFQTLYAQKSNADYVAALFARAGGATIRTPDPTNPEAGVRVTLTESELVNQLDAQTRTRAQVLRAVVQSREVDAREFNGAFVAMQYYGYLRRTPEAAGYDAWLTYLNAHPQDFRTMVNGFMNSVEYRLRFGRAR